MRVIGINGSAREDGNTALIIGIIFKELQKQGIQTELIQLASKVIEPCRGCYKCKGNRQCAFLEDDFKEIFNKMIQSDGIILGSPVYSADVSSRMKAFLERSGVIISTNKGLLKHKIGVSVVAVRRGGALNAVDTMNHFLLNKEVYLVGSIYWNMVFGNEIGEVLTDNEGIENMKNIGQNMAWLLKQINK